MAPTPREPGRALLSYARFTARWGLSSNVAEPWEGGDDPLAELTPAERLEFVQRLADVFDAPLHPALAEQPLAIEDVDRALERASPALSPDAADGDEHAILLLKPDAVVRAAVEAELRLLLERYALDCVAEATAQLSADDVRQISFRREEAFVRHLSEGPVKALLVRGRLALAVVYDVKWRLRELFQATDGVRNLVHAADPGNETAVLLRRFFPERETAAAIGTADQYWRIDGVAQLERGLAEAWRAHPHPIVIPVLPVGMAADARAADVLLRYGVTCVAEDAEDAPGGECEGLTAVRYWRLDGRGRRRGAGVLGLGENAWDARDPQRVMPAARAAGVRFALCWHPDHSLVLARRLEDEAVEAGLVPVAGSGRAPVPFQVANGAWHHRVLDRVLQEASGS